MDTKLISRSVGLGRSHYFNSYLLLDKEDPHSIETRIWSHSHGSFHHWCRKTGATSHGSFFELKKGTSFAKRKWFASWFFRPLKETHQTDRPQKFEESFFSCISDSWFEQDTLIPSPKISTKVRLKKKTQKPDHFTNKKSGYSQKNAHQNPYHFTKESEVIQQKTHTFTLTISSQGTDDWTGKFCCRESGAYCTIAGVGWWWLDAWSERLGLEPLGWRIPSRWVSEIREMAPLLGDIYIYIYIPILYCL